jgi:hypothetical protein
VYGADGAASKEGLDGLALRCVHQNRTEKAPLPYIRCTRWQLLARLGVKPLRHCASWRSGLAQCKSLAGFDLLGLAPLRQGFGAEHGQCLRRNAENASLYLNQR